MDKKAKEYLSKLSNKELDAMYSTMARSTDAGEPNECMNLVGDIIESRYDEFSKQKTKK